MASPPASTVDDGTNPTAPQGSQSEEGPIKILIKFTPENVNEIWNFPDDAKFGDLIGRCMDSWPEYAWDQCKVTVSSPSRQAPPPKRLLRSPADDDFDLSSFDGLQLWMLAQKRSDKDNLRAAAATAQARQEKRAQALERYRARTPATSEYQRRRNQRRAQEDAQYTFHTLRPLPHLPHPERSLQFLERLKADPGIRAAMRRHKFSVPLLTEMDPAAYTSSDHEGTTRILGLNRNQGEVIELRLRTDAYDGYRDYKTIRRTLCHELAHNVHGPHDRQFWDLCHQIEAEVAAADYHATGRTLGAEEYAPERPSSSGDEEEVMDHGGWTGGEFVLGAGDGSRGGHASEGELPRREILARAAEARLRNVEAARTATTNQDGGKELDKSNS
ncbi:hypothetical protein VTK73DRAFT_7032 [Phialemonium thermophilum]|uniref:WLM domain-containing protein n=1 Tax=Phialemonium thermophilum TaxID=223376 RepID=A0ABR3XUM7_9PEZI